MKLLFVIGFCAAVRVHNAEFLYARIGRAVIESTNVTNSTSLMNASTPVIPAIDDITLAAGAETAVVPAINNALMPPAVNGSFEMNGTMGMNMTNGSVGMNGTMGMNMTNGTNGTNATGMNATMNGTDAIADVGANGTVENGTDGAPSMELDKTSAVQHPAPQYVRDFCGEPIPHACYVWVVTLINCESGCNPIVAADPANDFGGCVQGCSVLPPAICGPEDYGGMCSLDSGEESQHCNDSCARYDSCVVQGDCAKKRTVQEFAQCFDQCVFLKE